MKTAVAIAAVGIIGAGMLAGCQEHGRCERVCRRGEWPVMARSYVEPLEGGGSTWSLVFNSPMTARAYAEVDPRTLAEYSRNDERLGFRTDTPLLATNDWPERERASLAYPRTITLERDPNQLLFFENESRYRGTYGPYGSGGRWSGDATWGFWR